LKGWLVGVYGYIRDEISVKISVLGVLYPWRCTDGGEIWHGGGHPPCQISPPSVRVAPVELLLVFRIYMWAIILKSCMQKCHWTRQEL